MQIIFTVCKIDSFDSADDIRIRKRWRGEPDLYADGGDGLSPAVVLGRAMVAILFAFEGWTNVGAIAGR